MGKEAERGMHPVDGKISRRIRSGEIPKEAVKEKRDQTEPKKGAKIPEGRGGWSITGRGKNGKK